MTDTNSFTDKLAKGAPGFLLGAVIAVVWFGGFAAYSALQLTEFYMGGKSVSHHPVWLSANFTIVLLALLFSRLRKHDVVSGILAVSIALTIYSGLRLRELADDAVARSGLTLFSAMKEHFLDSPSVQP